MKQDNSIARLRDKKVVIKEYIDGRITRKQASNKLGLSKSYISVLKNRYLALGDKAFEHGNSGKVSTRKVDKSIEDTIIELYENSYNGWNFTHFYEWILDSGELRACTMGKPLAMRTVSRILARNGFRSPKANKVRKKDKSIHPRRDRKTHAGEMVQLDASIHDWFDTGAKYALHIAIDDASSNILAGHFAKAETTEAYFTLVRDIFVNPNYGVPSLFYTDNRTSFTFNGDKNVSKRAKVHFKQACNRLGIDIITTSIPEAKGRVERCFNTLQDRLVNEMSVLGIKTLLEANKYLKEVFIPRHNQKYGVEPRSPNSYFRPLTSSELANLDVILAVRHTRYILKGNVVSYKNCQWLPTDSSTNQLKLIPEGEAVFIADNGKKEPKLIYRNEIYSLTCIKDGKTSVPISTHPWRRWRTTKRHPDSPKSSV